MLYFLFFSLCVMENATDAVGVMEDAMGTVVAMNAIDAVDNAMP